MKHPTLKKKGYDELVINNLDERDKNLKTKFGETIRVLDVPENLLIVEVTGGNYVGTLAICKNPDQITMKKAQDFGNMGDQILNYTKKNVLAINARSTASRSTTICSSDTRKTTACTSAGASRI